MFLPFEYIFSLSLKGLCHETFDLYFFLDSNPSDPLINRLKYFRIRFHFFCDIRVLKQLQGMHPTAESDCAVCIIPLSLTLRRASHCRVKRTKFLYKKIRGVHHTAESDYAVRIIPQSQTAQCVTYPWDWLRGVHHTAESREQNFYKKKSLVCITLQSPTPQCASYRKVRLVWIETEFENTFNLFIKGLNGFESWKK